MKDSEARSILLKTWIGKHGKGPPSEASLRAVLAIACHETGGTYGQGATKAWGTDVPDYHNDWGSVQAPKSEQSPCVAPNFIFTDSRPPKPGEVGDPKYGGNVTFPVCMKGADTPEQGCANFLEQIDGSKPWQRTKTWAAIQTGSPLRIATAMYDEHYYSGFKAKREEAIADYQRAIDARLKQFNSTIQLASGNGGEGADGTMAATRDYIGATKERFNAAWAALMYKANKNWPVGPGDDVILREFNRQWTDWWVWYNEFGETALGWLRGYDKVAAFDLNLTRVLRRAKDAGADVSSVPVGRAQDPDYKGEIQTQIGSPSSSYINLAWAGLGVLGLIGVGYVVQGFRKGS